MKRREGIVVVLGKMIRQLNVEAQPVEFSLVIVDFGFQELKQPAFGGILGFQGRRCCWMKM